MHPAANKLRSEPTITCMVAYIMEQLLYHLFEMGFIPLKLFNSNPSCWLLKEKNREFHQQPPSSAY